MTGNDDKFAIGIDLGGSAIKAGLVASDGRVIAARTMPTNAQAGVELTLDRLVELIDELSRAAVAGTIAGVGLGMPGTLDRRRGLVLTPPNLPGWRNVAIVERLTAHCDLPIVLDNDANLAAWGEYRFGAGRGLQDMVMLTLGTGVGSGIILDGRLFHGAGLDAAELGHTILHPDGRPCGCGQRGCLEAYASATATVRRAIERIERGESSSLRSILSERGALTTEDIVAGLDRDECARSVWAETCDALALACVNIHWTLGPQAIVLAGGMSGAGPRLLAPVSAAIGKIVSASLAPRPVVRLGLLGNDAGFIGSALSVFEYPDSPND